MTWDKSTIGLEIKATAKEYRMTVMTERSRRSVVDRKKVAREREYDIVMVNAKGEDKQSTGSEVEGGSACI